ncbi:hypothetical protein SUDANB25_00133 [Streptomyces sp. SudanB25_2051]
MSRLPGRAGGTALATRRVARHHGGMETPHTDWITVAAYENLPGRPHPMAATRA